MDCFVAMTAREILKENSVFITLDYSHHCEPHSGVAIHPSARPVAPEDELLRRDNPRNDCDGTAGPGRSRPPNTPPLLIVG